MYIFKKDWFLVNANNERVVEKELVTTKKENITVLFSPASASYDQFKNFVDRGKQFKKITKNYAKKFL